jgi:hypothetical protein
MFALAHRGSPLCASQARVRIAAAKFGPTAREDALAGAALRFLFVWRAPTFSARQNLTYQGR